jgi:hypothetical protein
MSSPFEEKAVTWNRVQFEFATRNFAIFGVFASDDIAPIRPRASVQLFWHVNEVGTRRGEDGCGLTVYEAAGRACPG